MDDIWVRLFGAFIAATGIWMIRIGQRSAAKTALARHWPTGTATVTRSQVRKRPGANATFRFDIEYRYEVGGREYRNDKIAVGGETRSGRTRAEKRQQEYPEGSTQTVYVNPTDPAEAYLDPKVEGGGRIEMFGGIAGILLGLLLLTGSIG